MFAAQLIVQGDTVTVNMHCAVLFAASVDADRQALNDKLEGRIMCTCGCRRPVNDCSMMNCGGHAAQTKKLSQEIVPVSILRVNKHKRFVLAK